MNSEGMHFISPTAVSTYRDCVRKWAFRYLDKVKLPPNRYAQKGIDVHDKIEKFLKEGTPPDPTTEIGKIVLAGIRYLPTPGTCAAVEEAFRWHPENEPFQIVGKIDWMLEADGRVVVGDNKTTSGFQWALDANRLLVDIQSNMYARYVMDVADVDEVTCRWVYFLTGKRPASRRVEAKLDKGEMSRRWDGILETCREMSFRLERHDRASETPYDVACCEKYGGCPYRDMCGIDPAERFRSIMAQLTLKEKMAARAQQTAAVNPPEQALPPPEVVEAPKAAPVQEELAATKAAPGPVAGTLAERMKARKTGMRVQVVTPPAVVVTQTATAQPAVQAVVKVEQGIKASDPQEKADDVALACRMIAEGLMALVQHLKGGSR